MLDSKEERESALLDVIEESEPTTLLMRCYKRFQHILIQQVSVHMNVFMSVYACVCIYMQVCTCVQHASLNVCVRSMYVEI